MGSTSIPKAVIKRIMKKGLPESIDGKPYLIGKKAVEKMQEKTSQYIQEVSYHSLHNKTDHKTMTPDDIEWGIRKLYNTKFSKEYGNTINDISQLIERIQHFKTILEEDKYGRETINQRDTEDNQEA